jgi:hypothetical protein
MTSVKRWYFAAELKPRAFTSKGSSIPSICSSARPPELGGGMVTMS